MAKITRAVKGVAKATANKRAKKVVTTGRDSSSKGTTIKKIGGAKKSGLRAPTIKDSTKQRAMTYEAYMKEKTLDAKQATDFIKICEKRPLSSDGLKRAKESIDKINRIAREESDYGNYVNYVGFESMSADIGEKFLTKVKKSGGSPKEIDYWVDRVKENKYFKKKHHEYFQKHRDEFPMMERFRRNVNL